MNSLGAAPCSHGTRDVSRTKAQGTLLQGDGGSALVELALTIGLLGVPLLLGVGALSPLVYASVGVENAAHSGALYGAQSTTTAVDTSGMISAAQTDVADFTTALTVVPATYWTCATNIGGTQYTSSSNATSACTGTNNHALQFVKVLATLQVTPLIRCPGVPTTWTLSSTSVMEVQQ